MTATTFNQSLEKQAVKLIDEDIKGVTERIVSGHLSEREYGRAAGEITGLMRAKEHISKAQTDIMKA